MVKKSQRIWIIFVGLFIALLAAFAVPKTEEKEVHGWNPNSNDYKISTVADLEAFRDAVNGGTNFSGKTITLEADIDLSGISNWTPIGNALSFNDTFSGGGHTISNLHCSLSSSRDCHLGLFGYIGADAKIYNLAVTDINISVTTYNSYSNPAYCMAGGIVSNSESGSEIKNCCSTGNITLTQSTGGTGSEYVLYAGGMAAYCQSEIINSYSNVNISLTGSDVGNHKVYKYVGALTVGGTVTNSYYERHITNNGKSLEYDSDRGISKTAAQFASGEVTYLLNGSKSTGWLAWYQTIGSDSYPVLWESSQEIVYYNGCGYSNSEGGHPFENGKCTVCGKYEPCEGSGTAADPYRITNSGQLVWFSCVVNGDINDSCADMVSQNAGACAKLMNNITVASGDSTKCAPIGKSSNKYSGIFDGNNKTISDIYISETDNSYTFNYYNGLFGYINGATIKDLGLVNFSETIYASSGNHYLGAVVGKSENSTVRNCYSAGQTRIGGGAYSNPSGCVIGGLIGELSGTTVEYCYSECSVDGLYFSNGTNNLAGGLIGRVTDSSSTIQYNHATGNVTLSGSGQSNSGGSAGGLIGYTVSDTYRCYALGSATSKTTIWIQAGGLIGSQGTSSIRECYAQGSATVSNGTQENIAGGLVGIQRDANTPIESSYAVGNVSYSNTGSATLNCAARAIGYRRAATASCEVYTLSNSSAANTGSNYYHGTTQYNLAAFNIGQVAYVLNGNTSDGGPWRQNVISEGGGDSYPVLDSSHKKVYYGYKCSSSSATYSNYELYPSSNSNAHNFGAGSSGNGFCTRCGAYQKPSSGTGTESDPYVIQNAGQLYWFAAVVNNELTKCEGSPSRNTAACARLGSNIIINSELNSDNARLWTPIGKSSGSDAYTGKFDNPYMSHYIAGMKINIVGTSTVYAGLFGYTYGATIRNVYMLSSNVNVVQTSSSVSYVGSIVGYQNGGTVNSILTSNVPVSVTNTNSSSGNVNAGGIIGYASGSCTINGLKQTGSPVSAKGPSVVNVGGVIGYFDSGSIENSYATSAVSDEGSNAYAGGFLGRHYGGTINNSYATGSVSSKGSSGTYAGGFVGSEMSGSISNAYAVGDITVSGSGTYAGRLVGYISGSTTNSYSLSSSKINNVSGAAKIGSSSVDGITKTSAEFASGEVTCLLNGGDGTTYASGGETWRQSLDSDAYPNLSDSYYKVVYTELTCGGSSRYYTNDRSYSDGHTFENGFCTSCGKYQGCEGAGTSDIPYEINNAGQLYWFACVVNGNTNNKCAISPT